MTFPEQFDGATENIPYCPSHDMQARIPVLIGPNTIWTY